MTPTKRISAAERCSGRHILQVWAFYCVTDATWTRHICVVHTHALALYMQIFVAQLLCETEITHDDSFTRFTTYVVQSLLWHVLLLPTTCSIWGIITWFSTVIWSTNKSQHSGNTDKRNIEIFKHVISSTSSVGNNLLSNQLLSAQCSLYHIVIEILQPYSSKTNNLPDHISLLLVHAHMAVMFLLFTVFYLCSFPIRVVLPKDSNLLCAYVVSIANMDTNRLMWMLIDKCSLILLNSLHEVWKIVTCNSESYTPLSYNSHHCTCCFWL
jgi:hypothetical protein